MKLTAALLLILLSLPLMAQAKPPTHKSAAKPLRIRVSLQIIEVPSKSIGDVVSGGKDGIDLYDALLKGTSSEVTLLGVETLNNTHGAAMYQHILAFTAQENGKPTRSVAIAPVTLEATPHINANHTITVDLKIEVTQVVPGAADATPNFTLRHLTARRIFTDQTLLVGDLAPLSAPGEKGASADAKHLLLFVTLSTP